MKTLITSIFVLFLTIFSIDAKAQITPIDDEALPEFIYQSKLVISPTQPNTVVKFSATFIAKLDGVGKALPATRTFKLYHILGSTLTPLSSQITITQADFPENTAVVTKEYSFTIEKSKLTGGIIGILYDIPNSPPGGTGTSYNYWIGVKPIIPPVQPTDPWGPSVPGPSGTIGIYSWVWRHNGGAHSLQPFASYAPTEENWRNEGLQFYAYRSQVAGTVPIYGHIGKYPKTDQPTYLYGTGKITNHSFWTFVDVRFYAFNTQVPGSVPIYCYVNAAGRDHYFSPNIEADPYWTRPYIAFYAYPKTWTGI